MDVKLAATHGPDEDARLALAGLEKLAAERRVGVALGKFMPDAGVSARLSAIGVAEEVEPDDFFRYDRIVVPHTGAAPQMKKRWEESGARLVDLSSPQVRRAQVALGLLRMEGARPLVIGRHDDPESRALAAGHQGARIIEDTTDTARLAYAPAFGVVCQTTLSPMRAAWLVQQLRQRYRDSRVTFLDTISPAMAAREQALERLLPWCDSVVVAGEPGEASCQALAEAALRGGKPALVTATPGDLDLSGLGGARRIALTAGAYAFEPLVREILQQIRTCGVS